MTIARARSHRSLLVFAVGAIGWFGCVGPGSQKVSSESSEVTVYADVYRGLLGPGSGILNEVYVHPQRASNGTWSSAIAQVPIDQGTGLATAFFTLPSWAWRDGNRGSYARFAVLSDHIVLPPVERACYPDYVGNDCNPQWQFPSGLADVNESAFYMLACTSDFLPKGSARRSYCDRPHVTMTDANGKNYPVFSYGMSERNQLISWVGDDATVLAVYSSTGDAVDYYGYDFGRTGQQAALATAYEGDFVTLLDIGECSEALPWAPTWLVAANELRPILEERIDNTKHIAWATVTDFEITPLPTLREPGAADVLTIDQPVAMLSFRVSFEAIFGRHNKGKLKVDAPLFFESQGGAALIRSGTPVLSGQDYDGVIDFAPIEAFIKSEVLKSAEQTFPLSALGLDSVKRLVVGYDALHAVTAEDGPSTIGSCDPAGERVDASGTQETYDRTSWDFCERVELNGQSFDDFAWVELFEHSQFKGRSILMTYPKRESAEFTSLPLVRGGFNDIASSVRWCAPTGDRIALYQNRLYTAGSKQLIGNGHVQGITDLSLEQLDNGANANDIISSVRWILPGEDDDTCPTLSESWVQFDQNIADWSNPGDQALMIFDDRLNIRWQDFRSFGMNDIISAVRYCLSPDTEVELYEHSDFAGRMMRLVGTGQTQEVRHLGDYVVDGWSPHDSVSSARIVSPWLDTACEWVRLYTNANRGGRQLPISWLERNHAGLQFLRYLGFGDSISSVEWCLRNGDEVQLWPDGTYLGESPLILTGSGYLPDLSQRTYPGTNQNVNDTIDSVRWLR